MIQNLLIQNYQSHRKTKLEFDSGVNCIIGKSDSGKSSILRSLNWLINNRPSGESFRSNWGGDTQVSIELDNQLIERIKTKKVNSYTLTDDSKNYQEFKAMGTEVPEEIKFKLNMNDINIQKQMDSPFLLSSSAGEVARYLNKIVQLDKIDSTLSNIESKKRKIKTNLDYKKNDLIKQESELKEFDWLDDAESKVKELEKLNSYFIKIKDKFSLLNTIIYNIKEVEDKKLEYTNILKYEEQVNSCLKLSKEIDTILECKTSLSFLVCNIKKAEDGISEYNGTSKYEFKVDEMILLNKEWGVLENSKIDLFNLLENTTEQEEKINKIKHKKEIAEKEFNKLMPDVCPLCEK